MRLIDVDAFKEYWNKEFRMLCPSDKFVVALSNFPTIDPESLRKKGEWLYNTDDFTPKKRCTNCGYNKPVIAGERVEQEPSFFCPNCGADMRGTENAKTDNKNA